MTDAEIADLTVWCSEILEALMDGREIVAEIAGHLGEEREIVERPRPGDQLSSLRCLVGAIGWNVDNLVAQLNRIQNQL